MNNSMQIGLLNDIIDEQKIEIANLTVRNEAYRKALGNIKEFLTVLATVHPPIGGVVEGIDKILEV